MNKRPLLVSAASMGIGILFGSGIPFLHWVHLALFSIFLLSIGIWLKRALPILIFGPALFGAFLGWSHTHKTSKHYLGNLMRDTPRIVVLTAKVREIQVHKRLLGTKQLINTQVILSAREIQIESNNPVVAKGKVLGKLPATPPSYLEPGAIVRVQGVLTKPEIASIPGAFDAQKYLRSRGIDFELRTLDGNSWELLEAPPKYSLLRISRKFQRWAIEKLSRGLKPDEMSNERTSVEPVLTQLEDDKIANLLLALALGWRTDVSSEIKESYMRSGTMHLFAISGLHIGILAGICIGVLRLFRLSRQGCAIMAIPIVWFYTLAVGLPASAVRAAIMTSIVMFGWLLKRPPDLLNSLGASAMIILVGDPLQIYQLGFQLSFGVMLALGGIASSVLEISRNHFQGYLPRRFKIQPSKSNLLAKFSKWFFAALVTSVTAWIGSAPLIAKHFNICTPITIIANLPMIPLTTLALTCAVGSLLTALILPQVSELFNWSAWLWIYLMDSLSNFFARLPGAYFYVQSPSNLTVGLWYFLLTMAGLDTWKHRWGVIVLPSTLVLTAITYFIGLTPQFGTDEITALPLPKGKAIVCKGPSFEGTILIDCGNEQAAGGSTKRFLRSKGCDSIKAFLLTTGLTDQIGGALFIITNFHTKAVYTNFATFTSKTYISLLEKLQAFSTTAGTILASAQRGTKIGPWEVLHPPPGSKFSKAADKTVVLYGNIRGTRVLIIPDSGEDLAANLITAMSTNIQADILMVGTLKLTQTRLRELIHTVCPRVIIVMDATHRPSSRSLEDYIAVLETSGIMTYFTSKSGAITISLSRKGLRIHCHAPMPSRYHRDSQLESDVQDSRNGSEPED